jgi:hypothetical protein
LLTYLKSTDLQLGILINFGDVIIKRGIKRNVNNLKEEPVKLKDISRQAAKDGKTQHY